MVSAGRVLVLLGGLATAAAQAGMVSLPDWIPLVGVLGALLWWRGESRASEIPADTPAVPSPARDERGRSARRE